MRLGQQSCPGLIRLFAGLSLPGIRHLVRRLAECASLGFRTPLVDRLDREAPVAADPEGGQLVLLEHPVDSRRMDSEIAGDFLDGQNSGLDHFDTVHFPPRPPQTTSALFSSPHPTIWHRPSRPSLSLTTCAVLIVL